MNVKRYEWREGCRYGLKANVAGKALERLGDELGVETKDIPPARLVEAAANESSPLHTLFTWDDGEAAQLYRESQARHVLRSIRIVVESSGEEKTFTAYVAVRTDASGKDRAYVPISVAAHKESLRTQMVEDAIRGLEGWKARYEHLAEASAALAYIDKAIAGLRRARVKDHVLQPVS